MPGEVVDGLNAVADGWPRFLQWDMLVRYLAQILLFSASAFFSGSETALFSVSKFDLQKLARARSPIGHTVHKLLEQPRRLIVSILCGNELVNIAAAANMTAILIELVGLEEAAIIATFVMVPLILLFGEVTPKTIAVSNPVWVSTRIVARPIYWWMLFVSPFARLVRVIADKVTTYIVGPERAEENILHVEELRTLVDEGVTSGEIAPTERSLIQSLIRACTTEIGEIMTPRTNVVFIDGSLTAVQAREQFLALRRARAPVYSGQQDNVIGFLFVEDVVDWDTGSVNEFDWHQNLHPPIAVPPTREVDEMLDFFEQNSIRAAMVVNEYGGIDGMVTLSDVTHYLFGGLFDEVALEEAEILPVEGAYEIDGDMPLKEVRRFTGLEIGDPSMRTVAGWVLRYFGRVPAVGEAVEIQDFVAKVIAMDGLRISRIRLQRLDSQPARQAKESEVQ